MQATERRATSSAHDDCLHRGPFLADLPWHTYAMRVQRTQKPSRPDADYSECFFFDKHYILSALYCQQLRYNTTAAIPRLVGSVCPPEEEDNGEAYAAYNLMLFSRARCPGHQHCADPFTFRSLLFPNDKPHNKGAVQQKPRFAPCWKMYRAEMHLHAQTAAAKEQRAEKNAVIAGTTIMTNYKDDSGNLHSAPQSALHIRPHLSNG